MADGRYRVTRGADGVRYLFLFPPDGSRPRDIVLDSEDDDEDLQVLIQYERGVAEWSTRAFATLLDELEGAATPKEGTE